MWLIIALILLGVLLLVAEVVLLPGFTVAGIGAFISCGAAIYFGFSRYGATGGLVVIFVIAALLIAALVLSLRAKTWQKLSLKNQVDGTSQPLPENNIKVGDRGVAATRLAPIGKIVVDGETYEAKSIGDIYVDERRKVEVVGFENFSVIVKVIE